MENIFIKEFKYRFWSEATTVSPEKTCQIMSGLKSYRSRPDHSVLKQSIEVSKTGMKQAIHALETGSKEVTIWLNKKY